MAGSVNGEEESLTRSILDGFDFEGLPTGFGKSLCYACLPRVFDVLCAASGSIVAIITPLNALIKDQVCSVVNILYANARICFLE